jgi:hypothetical protein
LRNGRAWSKLGPVASWLPQEKEARPLHELGPWRPALVTARLGGEPEWGRLSYIVIDELADKVVGLVVSPWPRVDERGRLHFADEDADDRGHVTVGEDAFLAVLANNREPIVEDDIADAKTEELRKRPLAIGDVFGARVGRRFRRGTVEPAEWIGDQEVLDITAITRTVAKGQTAAALAGVLDEEYVPPEEDER